MRYNVFVPLVGYELFVVDAASEEDAIQAVVYGDCLPFARECSLDGNVGHFTMEKSQL